MQTMDRLDNSILNHPFLKGLDTHFYHFFNECASIRSYQTGQEIFHEHGKADRFYFIQSGRVDLETFVPGRGMVTIQTLEPGEALGWSWLFPPQQWHFSASAAKPTELIEFDAAHLREKAEENRDVSNELSSRVARILLERLQGTREQLIDVYRMRP